MFLVAGARPCVKIGNSRRNLDDPRPVRLNRRNATTASLQQLACSIGYVSSSAGYCPPASLGRTLGTAFKPVHTQRHEHAIPRVR